MYKIVSKLAGFSIMKQFNTVKEALEYFPELQNPLAYYILSPEGEYIGVKKDNNKYHLA